MAIHKMPMMIRAAKGDCALKKIKLQLRLRMSCTANSIIDLVRIADFGVWRIRYKPIPMRMYNTLHTGPNR